MNRKNAQNIVISYLLRILRRIFHYKKTSIFKIKSKDAPLLKTSVNIEIIMANKDNVRDALSIQPEDIVSLFEQMLKDGELGFYAYCNNILIHHSWVVMGPKEIIPPTKNNKDHFYIDDKSAYIHYCVTSKDWRGKGVYPFMLSKIISILDEQYNYHNVYITVTGRNIPSIKGILKAQFKEYGNFYLINFFGIIIRKLKLSKNITSI